ncbi:RsmD family RNA methyltransferase [Patescibacteria group bacterium]|nr:RsmD family RNA methyltransferase [Patescibacteria group bacterium]
MHIYFSTFITGLSDIIEKELKEKIEDVSIKLIQDTFIIYETSVPKDRITSLRFFNNTFVLVKTFKTIDTSTKAINKIIKETINDQEFFHHLNKNIPKKKNSFRIVISVDNQMVSPDKNVLYKLENKISEKLNMQIHRSLPDVELWYFIRREGNAYFGVRLTTHTEYTKILNKGELHPELANILCYLSEPSKTDIFLDPFAGSGAIPIERAIAFPYNKIIAGDYSIHVIKTLKIKTNKVKKIIEVKKVDALTMSNFKDKTINKIVTDPPWGINIGKELDLEYFYRTMLQEFYRILKINGIIVILIGKKDIFENVLLEFSNQLQLKQQYNILVSGKKAGIYKLRKYI